MSEINVSKIKFSSEDVKNAAKKATVEPGWHALLIANPENKIAESGTFMTKIQLRTLADPKDAASVYGASGYHNIMWPVKNPEKEDHTPPKIGMSLDFLRAVYGEDDFPRFPYREDGVLYYQGETITKEVEEEKREEVAQKVFDKAIELLTDPADLADRLVYAEAYQNGDFLNFRNWSDDLPEGKELVPSPTQKKEQAASKAAKKGKK